LIVGCGIFGTTFARLATDAGKKCLIIDKREHVGGSAYTENNGGIHVHTYGPHVFHTSNKKVWDFVNLYADFNNFVLSPKASTGGKLFSLPFNMNTFYEMWGAETPAEVKNIIESQRFKGTPKNLEEQALSMVGTDIYEALIKGYTEKQWGKKATELPTFLIKRLPLRFIYDNNYFNDRYQGVPIGGFTQMFEKMLDGIEVKLKQDYFEQKDYYDSIADKIVYTGCIDEFFDYKYGELGYRSLKFETDVKQMENYQGCAVINQCDHTKGYTRTVEHKHFEKVKTDHTVITREYPIEHKRGMTPYYPINNKDNAEMYDKYRKESKTLTKYIFGGRLAEYKYMDMHIVIESAMNKYRSAQ
jgi:UDP-galactopyranose mutase